MKNSVKCATLQRTDFMFACFCGILLTLATTHIQAKADEDSIHLYFYPNERNSSERYEYNFSSSQPDKLPKSKRAKIIVHGADGHCLKTDVPFRAVQAYLRAKLSGKEDYNVFCLDYGPLAQNGPVPGHLLPNLKLRFEYACNLVSDRAADLILTLEENGYVSNLSEVHVIGHSLGGQVSGFIGRKIQEKTNYQRKLGRITAFMLSLSLSISFHMIIQNGLPYYRFTDHRLGLDAMNTFLVYTNEVNLRNQLDLSDADFVDIIHTSPVGLRGDYGHVDFYPDGGIHQRSCLTRGPVSNVTELLLGGCSHIIVGKYWEKSIENASVTACKSDSWEIYESRRKSDRCKPEETITFGEYVPTSARGKYYLEYPLLEA